MAKAVQEAVAIRAPNFQMATFRIVGTAPYVQARFSQKAIEQMKSKMVSGSRSRKGAPRAARDFDEDYKQAFHISTEGWHGIPASAFRNAMISACRVVGFKMTIGKLSVFVEKDGLDRVDAIPLIKIEGEPEPFEMAVRNSTGVCDIRVRPMWKEWAANVRIIFDADQFSATDVSNLLMRAGMQVGVGEGRPDSRSTAGMGWGTFTIANE